jgi:hypothetical protein
LLVDEWRTRVLFIVSLPYGRSYRAIEARLGKREHNHHPSIDWDSTGPNPIPSSKDLTTSVRHFAVCVIPLYIWNGRDKTLIQKFHEGAYWELSGPDPGPMEGDCETWVEEKIRHIDSIYEVGLITYSNDTISEEGKVWIKPTPRG